MSQEPTHTHTRTHNKIVHETRVCFASAFRQFLHGSRIILDWRDHQCVLLDLGAGNQIMHVHKCVSVVCVCASNNQHCQVTCMLNMLVTQTHTVQIWSNNLAGWKHLNSVIYAWARVLPKKIETRTQFVRSTVYVRDVLIHAYC